MSTDTNKKANFKGEVMLQFENLFGVGDITQTKVPIPGINLGPNSIQRFERLTRGSGKKNIVKQRRRKRVTRRSKRKSGRKRRSRSKRKQR